MGQGLVHSAESAMECVLPPRRCATHYLWFEKIAPSTLPTLTHAQRCDCTILFNDTLTLIPQKKSDQKNICSKLISLQRSNKFVPAFVDNNFP